MNYQSFLISNYSTGYDRELQPWLLPNDAFTDLLDGYVYRGVTNKRDGYSGFANGVKSTYCESRMVHRVTAEAYGTGDGTVVISNNLTILDNTPPNVTINYNFVDNSNFSIRSSNQTFLF